MKQLLDLYKDILENGNERMDRTGTGTISVFGRQMRFDLRDGFPIVTTKKLWIKGVWVELLWMLSGNPNGQYMLDNNVHIWDEWMDENKSLGRVYGVQWRSWRGKSYVDETYEYIDQLQNAIDTIKNNPTDRRMLVTAWNPGELDEMQLPPCHLLYQFYVEGPYLDIQVYQRSVDVFLGLPFDIASYATLLTMVAHITNKIPRDLIYLMGDTHIYTNHIEQVKEQITRAPHRLPELCVVDEEMHELEPGTIKSIDEFTLQNFILHGYTSEPAIKGDVSV